MKIDIATWDDPEDIQKLIDTYNKSHSLRPCWSFFSNKGENTTYQYKNRFFQ